MENKNQMNYSDTIQELKKSIEENSMECKIIHDFEFYYNQTGNDLSLFNQALIGMLVKYPFQEFMVYRQWYSFYTNGKPSLHNENLKILYEEESNLA